MKATNKPQATIQMIVPDTAIVQAVLTDIPASLTLETPSGAMRVEIQPGYFDCPQRLTKAWQDEYSPQSDCSAQ